MDKEELSSLSKGVCFIFRLFDKRRTNLRAGEKVVTAMKKVKSFKCIGNCYLLLLLCYASAKH